MCSYQAVTAAMQAWFKEKKPQKSHLLLTQICFPSASGQKRVTVPNKRKQ